MFKYIKTTTIEYFPSIVALTRHPPPDRLDKARIKWTSSGKLRKLR